MEQREYRQALGSLQDNGLDEYHDFEDFFDSYFADITNEDEELFGPTSGKAIPDALTLIQDGIAAGVLSRSKNDSENSGSEGATTMDDLATPALIGVETAAHYAFELGRYLLALPVTQLLLPSSNTLSIEEFISSTRNLHSVLLQ